MKNSKNSNGTFLAMEIRAVMKSNKAAFLF